MTCIVICVNTVRLRAVVAWVYFSFLCLRDFSGIRWILKGVFIHCCILQLILHTNKHMNKKKNASIQDEGAQANSQNQISYRRDFTWNVQILFMNVNQRALTFFFNAFEFVSAFFQSQKNQLWADHLLRFFPQFFFFFFLQLYVAHTHTKCLLYIQSAGAIFIQLSPISIRIEIQWKAILPLI